jgi:uncharacterized protein (TIRG00374 family)
VIRAVVGLAVAALALTVVITAAGGIDEALDSIRQADVRWVILGLGLEAMSYVFMGLQLHRLVGRPEAVGRLGAIGLGLVIFGFGLLTPAAPAEGLTLVGAELRRRRIDMRRVVLGLGFTQWFGPRSFYALASLFLVVAVLFGHLPVADVWPLLIVAALVVISLVVTARVARSRATAERAAVLLGRLQFWRPAVSAGDRRAAAGTLHDEAMAVMGSHANRVRLVTLSVAAALADAGCLWATLRSVHISLPPDEIYLAVVAGSIATWLPLLPGGLGVVEAAIPAVLHRFGAPLDSALAATLIYRGLGTFLPALAGSVVVVRLRAHRASSTATNG